MAQTVAVVDIAAKTLHGAPASSSSSPGGCSSGGNFNLSPGMDCDVMLIDDNGDLQIETKKWGLITKGGSMKRPLYNNESDIIKLCFSNLCFNARSETIYSKPTFSKLALGRRTCIIAVDGYFEWKSHPIPKMNKTKQPYFVYRKEELGEDSETKSRGKYPLLIAGLWTKVSTGIQDAPVLESFAMLTTDASEQIKWLHHRMPVCIWDKDLAKQWLNQPSEILKKKIDDAARYHTNGFGWHRVTPEMSKLSFRSEEAIMEVKEINQSIKQFFAHGKSLSHNSQPQKCKIEEKKKPPCVRSNVIVSKSLSNDLAPTKMKGEKRQLTLSSSYFSPTCKKGKVKRPPNSKPDKQIRIDSFFRQKK